MNTRIFQQTLFAFALTTFVSLAFADFGKMVISGSPSSQPATPPVIKSTAVTSIPQPNPSTYKQVADELTAALQRQDRAAALKLTDADSYFRVVVSDLKVPPTYRDSFIAAMKDQTPILSVINGMKDGGITRFCKVSEKDGEIRALFYHFSAKGDLDFLDFILSKNADSNYRVTDVYSYAMASFLSTRLHQRLLFSASKDIHGFLDHLKGVDRDDIVHVDDFRQIQANLHAHKGSAAMQQLDALPPDLRDRKQTFALRFAAAAFTSPAELEKTLAAYDNQPSHDISAAVNAYAFCISVPPNFEAGNDAITFMRKEVGDNPALDFAEARLDMLHHSAEASRTAEGLLRRALVGDSTLTGARMLLIGALEDQDKFEDAVQQLEILEKQTQQKLAAIDNDPHFASLAASAPYKSYRANHQN